MPGQGSGPRPGPGPGYGWESRGQGMGQCTVWCGAGISMAAVQASSRPASSNAAVGEAVLRYGRPMGWEDAGSAIHYSEDGAAHRTTNTQQSLHPPAICITCYIPTNSALCHPALHCTTYSDPLLRCSQIFCFPALHPANHRIGGPSSQGDPTAGAGGCRVTAESCGIPACCLTLFTELQL